jgi:hypothetical protein
MKKVLRNSSGAVGLRRQPTPTMINIEITAALAEAKASAVMITEGIYTESGPEYIAAITAIAAAQSRPSPFAALAAENAALVFLAACPEVAMNAINKRIAARAAKSPISDAAARALIGQD